MSDPFLTNGARDDDFEDFYAGVGPGMHQKNPALDKKNLVTPPCFFFRQVRLVGG